MGGGVLSHGAGAQEEGRRGENALKTSTCRRVGKSHLDAPEADPLLEGLEEGLRDVEDEGLRLA